jgi:hypothetical protein
MLTVSIFSILSYLFLSFYIYFVTEFFSSLIIDCFVLLLLLLNMILGTRNAWVGNAEPASVDGGLTDTIKTSYEIVGKLGDTFNIVEAFPGYGHSFLGGPVIDLLLWFTDYHHFHSPVTGTVVYANNFMGSHQYDFDNFDPNFPFGTLLLPYCNNVSFL